MLKYFVNFIVIFVTEHSDYKSKARLAMDVQHISHENPPPVHLVCEVISKRMTEKDAVLNRKLLLYYLTESPETRNIWYLRMSKTAHKFHMLKILRYLLPIKVTTLHFATPSDKIGGGLLVVHGGSCIVRAELIGEWFSVYQRYD